MTHSKSIASVTEELHPGFERWASYLLLALIVALFAMQLSSLFVFPQPNSLRWYGDETWLMSEANTQITTGAIRYPLAVGSTLEHSKGLVLSMTWLSAALYGLPVAIIASDPVAIGRVVTALLSLLLLMALYHTSRLLGASRIAALVGVALLLSTRAFFFASHSCRTDLLAGFIVLLFVATLLHTILTPKDRSRWWWFGFGAITMFLAISSSIHLLTLLGPVALFFAWRLGAFRRWSTSLALMGGIAGTLGFLIVASLLTHGSLTLFTPGAHQFRDVLSSIPILRPFSRSVQSANMLIRIKQLWSEASSAYLFAILIWFVPFYFQRSKQGRLMANTLGIVLLSWLFLEGAEINYLIHILPLVFFAMTLALTNVAVRFRSISYALIVAAIVFIGMGLSDATIGAHAARTIDRSNADCIHAIEKDIHSTSQIAGNPLVLAEPPALERLSQDSHLRVMTDHFISFPELEEPIDSFLAREHVNYAVLYNSPTFPKDRASVDSLYRTIQRVGTLIDREIGTSGDVGRDYFHPSDWKDTLLLFKLPY